MGKFFGPGYVRVGPITAGALGVGCLLPLLAILSIVLLILTVAI